MRVFTSAHQYVHYLISANFHPTAVVISVHSTPTQNDIPRQLAITDMNLCDPIQSPELRAFFKVALFRETLLLTQLLPDQL